MKLAGHHAVVTGGGTGIGSATARALAGEGARVTLIGRRREPLEIAATGTGFFATADVTDRAQVDRAFAEAREMQGPISILVNNAGAAESAPFAKLTDDGWRRMMGVNLDGVFHCCQAALPDLLDADHGRIVTIASTNFSTRCWYFSTSRLNAVWSPACTRLTNSWSVSSALVGVVGVVGVVKRPLPA